MVPGLLPEWIPDREKHNSSDFLRHCSRTVSRDLYPSGWIGHYAGFQAENDSRGAEWQFDHDNTPPTAVQVFPELYYNNHTVFSYCILFVNDNFIMTLPSSADHQFSLLQIVTQGNVIEPEFWYPLLAVTG